MDSRRIGRSDLKTAPIALGSSVFGWTVPEGTAFDILDRFVARGFDLIDTADVYYLWANGNRGGESETIIGNWLKSRGGRDRVKIATKVGESFGDERQGLKRDYIMAGVEASLKRLQTDYIDLYQAHIDDPETPLDETLEAFDRLIEAGKARVIGASNYEALRLAAALETSAAKGLPRFESFQTLYNLYDRAVYEKELAPICRSQDLGVLTYRSLAQGFLTGKYRREDRPEGTRFAAWAGLGDRYLTPRNRDLAAAVEDFASVNGRSLLDIAFLWLLARPSVASVIAGATRPEQIAANAAAASAAPLTREELKTIEDLAKAA